jgi:hypothetical protein
MYKQSDRWYYRKIMPDGTLKRVKIFMTEVEIQSVLWSVILEKQLQVSQDYLEQILANR